MNTNQPKVICRQLETSQLGDLQVGEIAYDTIVSKYVGRNKDGKITYIEAQSTTELELPEGSDEGIFLMWSGTAWVTKTVSEMQSALGISES